MIVYISLLNTIKLNQKNKFLKKKNQKRKKKEKKKIIVHAKCM